MCASIPETKWRTFSHRVTFSVTVAIDAMQSASNPHAFMGVTEQGLAAIVKTRGNKDVHVILRGGTKGPNYASEHVRSAASVIEKKRKAAGDAEPIASVMIDCSRTYLFFSIFLTRMGLLTPFLIFFLLFHVAFGCLCLAPRLASSLHHVTLTPQTATRARTIIISPSLSRISLANSLLVKKPSQVS